MVGKDAHVSRLGGYVDLYSGSWFRRQRCLAPSEPTFLRGGMGDGVAYTSFEV